MGQLEMPFWFCLEKKNSSEIRRRVDSIGVSVGGRGPSKTERRCFVQKDHRVLIRPTEAMVGDNGVISKAEAYNLELEE